MDEMSVNGIVYVSTKKAADLTGYTTDYVAQLARGGKIDARLVGRNWFINQEAILKQKFGSYAGSVGESIGIPNPKISINPEPNFDSHDVLEPEKSQKNEIQSSTPQDIGGLGQRDMETLSGRDLLAEMQEAWEAWYERRDGSEKISPIDLQDAVPEVSMGDIHQGGEEESIPLTLVEAAPPYHSPYMGTEKRKEDSSYIPHRDLPIKRQSLLPQISGVVGGGLAAALLFMLIAFSWSILIDGREINPANPGKAFEETIYGSHEYIFNRD
jgi:hypothetical protein